MWPAGQGAPLCRDGEPLYPSVRQVHTSPQGDYADGFGIICSWAD